MHQSHIIEVQGVFVGVAVQIATGLRFVAVDPRVVALDGDIAPTLEESRRQAASLFHRARPQAQTKLPVSSIPAG